MPRPSRLKGRCSMRFDESKVTYTLECFPEEMSYVGNCSAIDDETDRQQEAWIRSELQSGNEWAWCWVKVTARYKGIDGVVGIDTLGGCSYRSEEDFRQPGDYFDDMKAAALADLRAQLEAIAAEIC